MTLTASAKRHYIGVVRKTSYKSPIVIDHEHRSPTCLPSRPWKPLTFSSGILIPLAGFSLGLAVLIGFLQWQNARNGALMFAATGDTFSPVQTFLYRFCPTIIVVLYGIGWSWVDLDVKRLEPWFQLARNEGSSAQKSLLLHYPVDFLPSVPFKAAQRRQWTVLTASTITLFVAWGVTPLQNAIFANNFINVPTVVDVVMSPSLLPLANQSSKIGLDILNIGFSILWLGQSIPPFTTAEYAITPFKSFGTQNLLGSNHTLSAQTTMYSTDLVCKPPDHIQVDDGQVTFDDGDGCIAADLIQYADADPSAHYQTYYIGYYDDPNSDFSLQLAGCPSKSSHSFLAIWKLASDFPPDFHNPANATALFCKPSYYTQFVNATVSLPDYSVISTTPVGPRSALSELDFNITQFEYLLANGILPPALALARQDIADTTVLRQDSKVQNLSIAIPVTNMVGFAIGATHFAPEDYLDPAKLSYAFQNAHRLLFNLGIQNVFSPIAPSPTTTGLIQSVRQAVTVVPVFALLSQSFLALIVVATCSLLHLVSRQKSKLACDPDSLAQVMAMSNGQGVQELFSGHDTSDDKALASALALTDFKLDWQTGSQHPTLQATVSRERARLPEGESSTQSYLPDTSNNSNVVPVQPGEYSLILGLPLCLGLTIMITSLVLLHQKSIKDNGLPLPSTNPLVQQIVLNYLPTALATVLEPTLVLLTRLTCMMRPLEELRKGNSRAQRSLLLRYTSIPPPLVIWRAMKSRDSFLVVLTFTAISANLLTVTLSGLFSQTQIYRGHSVTLHPVYLPKFLPQNASDGEAFILNSYNQNDAFHIASANFTNQISLPPWTSQHYYFLPSQSNSTLPENDRPEMTFLTLGFGADLACQEMTTTPSDAMYSIEFNANATLVSLTTSHVLSDGSVVNCKTSEGGPGPASPKNYINLSGDPQGRKALEIAQVMRPLSFGSGTFAQQEMCSGLIVRGWVRADISYLAGQLNDASKLSSENSATVSATFISCRARPKSAMSKVTTSPSGQILASTQDSLATYDLPSSVNLTSALTTTSNNLGGQIDVAWHNDTFASDWSNYLFKTFTNSTTFLDARSPPPSFEAASAVVGETYSRVFAIQMSLQTSHLVPASSEAQSIGAEFLTLERRVFMSNTMFYISIAILSLDLVVAVLFYSRTRKPFLPRLPITIASQIAFFAGSHVMDDVQNAGGDLQDLDGKGYRYGYGRYVGKDGKVHVGIEREPYVMHPAKHRIVARP